MNNERDAGPLINRIDMNMDEYREFIESVQFILIFSQRYFNRIIFSKPIEIPNDIIDMKTDLIYQDDSILYMIDLNVSE